MAAVQPIAPAAGTGAPVPLAETPLRWRLVVFERGLSVEAPEGLERLLRELSDERLATIFASIPAVRELATLRTCHRFEVYGLVADGATFGTLERALGAASPGPWRRHSDEAAIHHVYRVAWGLESLAVGEPEVRAQVRRARVRSRHPKVALGELFRRAALEAEREAAGDPAVRSMAALAARVVLERAGGPFPRVVVVGAGAMGRRVAERLSTSARVTLVYRSAPPDETFLRAVGARAVSSDALAEELALADAVVTAAKTDGRVIGARHLARRPAGYRPLLAVDLGMPRNLDPDLAKRGDVTVLDLESLRPLAREDPELERAAHAAAERAAEDWARRALEPWTDAVRRRAERIRREEWESALDRLSESLTDRQRRVLERMTQRLVNRLWSAPTRRLRRLPATAEAYEARRMALALFEESDRDCP